MQHYFFDRKRVGIKNIGESMTVPDDSYTIKELIARFTIGCIPPVGRNVIYDDNPDFECIDPLCDPAFDLVDRDALARESQNTISRITAQLKSVQSTNTLAKEDVSKE